MRDSNFRLFLRDFRAICVERDAESDANFHEKVVVEQFTMLQPLFRTDLKHALISELVASLAEG